MRYIRTKQDVIIDTQNMHPETLKWYRNVHMLKESNTIEELCDEFVAVGIPFRTFVVDLDEIKRSGLDIHSFSRACYVQYKNCAIYGAIYTDKGLIYVAKMNEEGELELL